MFFRNFFDWFTQEIPDNSISIGQPSVLYDFVPPPISKTKKRKIKCALVIGHKKTSQGAHNEKYNISEFDFNDKLTQQIGNHPDIVNSNIEVNRIYRRTYNQLPHDINEYNPDFIISLHCNAFNKKASGSEVLYYHKSKMGKKIADILNKQFKSLPNNNRGIRPKSAEDRGGYLLMNTNAPCIIAEPFFIDNDTDYNNVVIYSNEKLITAYVKAIIEISKIV